MKILNVSSRKLKISATALLAAALSLTPVSAQFIWNSGHGDLGIGYDGDNLEPHVHLHEGAFVDGIELGADAEYEPGELRPVISFNQGIARPAGSQWNFLGVNAGETVWIFPQTQDLSLPWIGFAAEELDPSDWASAFTITLTGLAGSGFNDGGNFSVYITDAFGFPSVFISSFDPSSVSDPLQLAAGGHDHYNFAFTQPGIYEATFLIEGFHGESGAKSAFATYTFEVAAIPEPSSFAALAGLAALGLVASRRRPRA